LGFAVGTSECKAIDICWLSDGKRELPVPWDRSDCKFDIRFAHLIVNFKSAIGGIAFLRHNLGGYNQRNDCNYHREQKLCGCFFAHINLLL
jgi:hypothetical protein